MRAVDKTCMSSVGVLCYHVIMPQLLFIKLINTDELRPLFKDPGGVCVTIPVPEETVQGAIPARGIYFIQNVLIHYCYGYHHVYSLGELD